MADHCAHCNATEIQYQVATYQCLHCGELTRIDNHQPVHPVAQSVAPGSLERIDIHAPWTPTTYEDWRQGNENRPGRQPQKPKPPGVSDQYTTVGEAKEDPSKVGFPVALDLPADEQPKVRTEDL